MTPAYAAEIGFIIEKTSVRAQKINGLLVKTYNMGLTWFSI